MGSGRQKVGVEWGWRGGLLLKRETNLQLRRATGLVHVPSG